MPPLRGNTADSRQFRGKGLANLPYWGNPARLWPEWPTQKALPDYFPPFKHPLFYNPLLLSLSLCVVLKEPVNAPPPTIPLGGGSGEVLVKPSSALAHLSSFNFLNRGMRGQKERQLSGFSPLLNHFSPKSVCFPLCVFVFALTGNTAFCPNSCPNAITEPQFLVLMKWRL